MCVGLLESGFVLVQTVVAAQWNLALCWFTLDSGLVLAHTLSAKTFHLTSAEYPADMQPAAGADAGSWARGY